MPIITLKKAVEHEGKTWSEVDFDPSLDALEAFNKAILGGGEEVSELKKLVAFDGDTPIEVAGKLRLSALMAVKDVVQGPFGDASNPSVAGERSPLT